MGLNWATVKVAAGLHSFWRFYKRKSFLGLFQLLEAFLVCGFLHFQSQQPGPSPSPAVISLPLLSLPFVFKDPCDYVGPPG